MAINPDRTVFRQLFTDYEDTSPDRWMQASETTPERDGLYWTVIREKDQNGGLVELTYWWNSHWHSLKDDHAVVCWKQYDRSTPGWPDLPDMENLQFDVEDIT